MDIFVLPKTTTSFDLKNGILVNDYSRVIWVEKFREASEFSIEAPLDSNIREEMPIGSLVSHIETDEVLIVEDHEIVISEDPDIQDTVKISGRGFETFLDNRIIGSNRNWSFTTKSAYELATSYACVQARTLIRNHIDPESLLDDNDAIPDMNIFLDPLIQATTNPLYEPEDTIFEFEPLYEAVLQILTIDNLGFCTRRPRGKNYEDNYDNPTRYDPKALTLCIYPALDRTKTVTFSHAMGDIKNANYLFSNRLHKTSCLVHSRYFTVMVHGPQTGISRRVMVLSAADLDEQFDSIPGAPGNTKILNAMRIRGRAALAGQNLVAISNVELDQSDLPYTYRKDYGLGDYVSVHGDYQTSTTLQVIEHVEVQDETGYFAYPTLAEPPEGGYYVPPQFFN